MSAGMAGVASAGIGAASSIAGGVMGKGAAKKARKRASRSLHHADASLQAGLDQANPLLEEGYQDAAGGLDNYANLGEGALAKLAWGLGFDVPGFDTSGLKRGGLLKNFSEEDFRTDPGYNFIRSEGQRGIQNSAAARGSALSGATLKALTRFNQGTADQQYQNAYNRYNQDRTLQSELLTGVGRMGQQAKTAQAGFRQNTSARQADNITNRYTGLANLHAGFGGMNANLALRQGNYAQNAMQGISNIAGSFFSRPAQSNATGGGLPAGVGNANAFTGANTPWDMYKF